MPASTHLPEVMLRARHVWITALAAVVALGCGSGSDGGEETPAAPAATSAAASPTAASQPGAQAVIDAISQKWPAPDPADNTGGCKAEAGDTAAGCLVRITTDAVTVTEFADEATAKRWATELGKTGDHRQAGRFVLSWTARDQDLTSEAARDSMVAIATSVVG